MTLVNSKFDKYVKVGTLDQCWNWTGGGLRYGRYNHKGANVAAHRLVFETVRGTIPDGMCVCHSCDNVKCVNPNHLWLGTQQDNMLDKQQKGRCADTSRSKNGNYRVTEEQRIEIREKRLLGTSCIDLGKMYSVSREHIRRICHD